MKNLSSNLPTVNLCWKGPYNFHDIIKSGIDDNSISHYPGVYIWAEKVFGKTCIGYVGKHQSSIYKRMLDHYRLFAGGLYSVPYMYRENPHYSKQEHWIFKSNKKECIDVILDQDKLIQLIKESLNYARQINLYTCQLESKNNLIKAVERNLLFDIKPMWTKVGTKTQPNNLLKFIHVGELNDVIIKGWKDNTKFATQELNGNLIS